MTPNWVWGWHMVCLLAFPPTRLYSNTHWAGVHVCVSSPGHMLLCVGTWWGLLAGCLTACLPLLITSKIIWMASYGVKCTWRRGNVFFALLFSSHYAFTIPKARCVICTYYPYLLSVSWVLDPGEDRVQPPEHFMVSHTGGGVRWCYSWWWTSWISCDFFFSSNNEVCRLSSHVMWC